MPGTMNIDGNTSMCNVKLSDDIFAIHGLAVIAVHDAQLGEKEKLTLSEITNLDEHLKFTRGTLLYGFLTSFGRQSVPVFKRILIKNFKMTDEMIKERVNAVISDICRKLK